MNLAHTADLMVKRIADRLQPFELSPGSALALGILADSETPLPPNVIADRLIISRATVTGLIDSLERRNYVQRHPSLTDRRMVLVEITDLGRQVAADFRQVVHQNEKRWFEVLSEPEQAQLIELLHRLQDSLQESE